MTGPNHWRICVDTGGTFTDAVAMDPRGVIHRAKVLSSAVLRGRVLGAPGDGSVSVDFPDRRHYAAAVGMTPAAVDADIRVVAADADARTLRLDGPAPAVARTPGTVVEFAADEEAPILATRVLTGTAAGGLLPPLDMRLATTRGTNALLTGAAAPVALFVTAGHADLLRIGTQQRPDIFALDVRRPSLLDAHPVEVPERISTGGGVLRRLDLVALAPGAKEPLGRGVRVAAVALMHSDRFPDHELRLERFLLDLGFEHVSVASRLAPFIGYLDRATTAVVDAALSPTIDRYLSRVGRASAGSRVLVMTSAGGLTDAAEFRPKDSLLSGPAGGVVGALHAARRSGLDRVIAFDMGGTSTDVARIDGAVPYTFTHTVASARLVAPAVAVESVAAGGGSICRFDGASLAVGPQSAGAEPGPACYGRGGPFTLTDVNLLLGRIAAERFRVPLDTGAAEAALAAVAEHAQRPQRELLLAFLDIAAERIAGAVRRVSSREGYEPSDYPLLAFGGAGGQIACAVAERLGMSSVVVPTDAGLLSALGLAEAAVERFAERQFLAPLAEVSPSLPGTLAELERTAADAARAVAGSPSTISRRIAALRLAGQDQPLEVTFEDPDALDNLFRARYRQIFNHEPDDRPTELVWVRVVAASADPWRMSDESHRRSADGASAAAPDERPVHERAALVPGSHLHGPTVIAEDHACTVIEPGWLAHIDGAGAIIATRSTAAAPRIGGGHLAVEVFSARVESIAREMGESLRRTALSVNVKERLDYSCAVLDAAGRLVACAPHVPVHLGSLGVCVRAVAGAIPLGSGDAAITNHPALGGSHLPDLTVVTPVYADAPGGTALVAYVASRAHHAEIGGRWPGSMPPDAASLAEEGVVVPPMHVIRAGACRLDDVARVLSSGPWPTRALGHNLADIRAAIAANAAGAAAIGTLARHHRPQALAERFESVHRRAEARMRLVFAAIPDGEYLGQDALDDGSVIRVRITVRGDAGAIDFSGSAAQHPRGYNATEAIVRSAVVYFLRLLVREPLPLNEGLLRAVSLTIGHPSILSPAFTADPASSPPVAAGNVETSQRIVDVLLRALAEPCSLAAASQGTMNNVIFGDGSFAHYETIGGGSGAGPAFPGEHAVHSHMTNTRITDPEILETRCPVRLERFAIRRGSGGAGVHPGGDGAVREITFLAPARLSVITQRRTTRPFGVAGGEPGLSGHQHIRRVDGTTTTLGHADGADVRPGDTLVMSTPGGGGWGALG